MMNRTLNRRVSDGPARKLFCAGTSVFYLWNEQSSISTLKSGLRLVLLTLCEAGVCACGE